MAVLYGFDLSEMSWDDMSYKKMFDARWHLRRERFVIYTVAMILCLAAQGSAMFSVFKYEHHQTHIEDLSMHTAQVHNNDFIAAAIFSVVLCTLVSTVFGIEYFLILFWPGRVYSRRWNRTKKALALLTTMGMAAAAIMSTVIVSMHSERITGVSDSTVQQYVAEFPRPPLKYGSWPINVAYIILLWLGVAGTLSSTVLMLATATNSIPALVGDVPEVATLNDEQSRNSSGTSRNEVMPISEKVPV
ncbi:hypothetical protein BDQ12DRAFT_737256 [Crucibulum laeve]|uniref:Uncharacterized protein n=1 Tax=Crucibulum laeve TaxID=68775 RepID=A0A5C3LTW0_9AGAR|nr:hypothetical protein BDQ12DRAFT_737256 [Crucibulum laeve]